MHGDQRDARGPVDVHDLELAAPDQLVRLRAADAQHRGRVDDLQQQLLTPADAGTTHTRYYVHRATRFAKGFSAHPVPVLDISRSHDHEPIDKALDLFWHAFPDEQKQGGPARIALVVGSEEWAEAVRRSAAEEVAA